MYIVRLKLALTPVRTAKRQKNLIEVKYLQESLTLAVAMRKLCLLFDDQ